MARLLHISGNDFPDLAEEHATKQIWRELAKGFDEYHILARGKDNHFHHYQEGNIYLHLVPRLGRARWFVVTSLLALPLMLRLKPDIVLAQSPLVGGPVAAFASRLRRVPLMIELHGMHYFGIFDGRGPGAHLLSTLMRYAFRRATKIRSLGPTMTRMLRERGVGGEIVEIPTRVDLCLFGPPKTDAVLNGPIRLIGVGSFVRAKAFESAIEATLRLRDEHDVELTLIGGGPLRSVYEALAAGSGSVRLLDRLPQSEIVEQLRRADVYVQPSLSEGLPRAVLEAMALRLPVVASQVGTVPDLIEDRVNGLLIRPGNTEDLTEAIELLITDDALRESIAARGCEDVCTKYEWNRVFDLYRRELLGMVAEDER